MSVLVQPLKKEVKMNKLFKLVLGLLTFPCFVFGADHFGATYKSPPPSLSNAGPKTIAK